jgi:hypothetical protein
VAAKGLKTSFENKQHTISLPSDTGFQLLYFLLSWWRETNHQPTTHSIIATNHLLDVKAKDGWTTASTLPHQ